MSEADRRQQAVDRNFAAFKKLLPELLKTHPGKFALLRDETIVEYFDTARDAMIYGQKEYPDGLFSIQQVTDTVVDLGYFSHAVHIDPV
ncbi:MAG: hypothetical protein ACE5KF_06735 [Kiloniellaceae bacterium]